MTVKQVLLAGAVLAVTGAAIAAEAPRAAGPGSTGPRPTRPGGVQPADHAQARPPVDAPELARLGAHPIGLARVKLVQPGQADPLQGTDQPLVTARRLPTLVWYPAAREGPGTETGTTYHAAMSGADGRDVPFTLAGLATPDARAAAGRFPLVILAHGYGNAPEALAWLGENLASKGYVVVAPAFGDPPISIRTAAARSGPITRRPLDIAFVAAEAQRRAARRDGVFAAADASRTVLIGYSMGGYGVLTAAGAPLNPQMGSLSRGILADYAAGGVRAASLKVANVKAVVAIAPASRFGEVSAWSPSGAGVGAITAPTLFIAGDHDHAVGYDAVRDLFAQERRAPRYLLTFKGAGHSIALAGAPAEMRGTFWNMDWFEDAVWRRDRLLPIQTHFITAFLDRFAKGETAKATYLDGLVSDADAGTWPNAPIGRYDGFSPGAPVATVWKGFQPSRATGLRFEAEPAS